MDPPSQERVPSLSRDAAKQAFVKYASDKRCFSTKPAQEGVTTDIEAFDTYRDIDTSGQTPPRPWEISISVPALFEDRDTHH
ncbi:hypothetical protein LDENG_00059860 [Lucifuga dentata]|nr:hypothetical protein LDENG_00059860 [Lucifuga dentata]